MMKQEHVYPQIADYVLELLPQAERWQVEQHTVSCAHCRAALQNEAELGQMVRATLTAVTRPPVNLRRFMPAPRQKSNPALTWQRQLAPLAMVAFLLLGSLVLYRAHQSAIWARPSPTFLAVTATMTDAPTVTMTETRAEAAVAPVTTKVVVNTAVPAAPDWPHSSATPAPHPTPIAAMPVKLTSYFLKISR